MMELIAWLIAAVNLIFTSAWAFIAFVVICAYVIAARITIKRDKANKAYNAALEAQIEQERINQETPFVCACGRRFAKNTQLSNHTRKREGHYAIK